MGKEKVLPVLEKLIKILTSGGFVQQRPCMVTSAETHEVPANVYAFGPTGACMRRNLINEWWKSMVTRQECSYAVEAPALSSWPQISETTDNKSQKTSSNETCLQTDLSRECLHHYLATLEMIGHRLPFSLACVGMVFRPSIEPADMQRFLCGSLCPQEMVFQVFCPPSSSNSSFDQWQRYRLKWWGHYAGSQSDFTISEAETENGTTQVSIMYQFPWGPGAIETITNKGDTILKHMESQTGISHMGRHSRKSVHPHLIECIANVDRGMCAYLMDSYTEIEKSENKNKATSTRMFLQLHHQLAPFKVAISTVGSKVRDLRELATYTAKDLRNAEIDVLDLHESSSSYEAQSLRFDAMAVPYSVVLKDSTLETGIVGLRSRDTTLKQQIHVTKLKETLQRYLAVK